MTDNRFLKRLRKKAKKGLRGWPLATIAFYGPNLSQATKAAVGIMPSENAEVGQPRPAHDARCRGRCVLGGSAADTIPERERSPRGP
jgi:hypothetical protein